MHRSADSAGIQSLKSLVLSFFRSDSKDFNLKGLATVFNEDASNHVLKLINLRQHLLDWYDSKRDGWSVDGSTA